MSGYTPIELKSLNTARALILDTVRHADSGHSGGPLSSLDFTYLLYKEFLAFDPDDPNWINRDRFVLSAGHESALLYTMLTYVGWLTPDDLKNFRQLGSRTPGHPEKGLTPGVESTTGPLGQGVGNAVGMAVAEVILREKFGEDVISHYTYLLHGDGDIQEPVAQGAIALAGHWGLHKLIAFYDANNAQISGKVSRSDSTDYRKLYESHRWHVQEIDGHDPEQIREAIRRAQMEVERPSVIIGKTVMAKGTATREGDHTTHGAPLPPDEIASTKEKLGLDPERLFQLPKDVVEDFRQGYSYYRQERSAWDRALTRKLTDTKFRKLWEQAFGGKMNLTSPEYYSPGKRIATRKSWGRYIEHLNREFPLVVGGSADLEPSNVTEGFAKAAGDFGSGNPGGRNFAYGVREFPMGVINNGIALHGGLKVFGATFFVFSDYERPALRMRALMKLPVVSEYTHDSIFVGEDGPTHQPVEHLMACRTIPRLVTLRPADANEALEACRFAFEQTDRPVLVILSRQSLPVYDRTEYPSADQVLQGAYVMSDCSGFPDITILASGSEVETALQVKELLGQYNVRVVNIASWELFDKQTPEYKRTVLGDESALRVSIEAGITQGWQKYTGLNGLNFGIDDFGESAPGKEVSLHFKLTPEHIRAAIEEKLTL